MEKLTACLPYIFQVNHLAQRGDLTDSINTVLGRWFTFASVVSCIYETPHKKVTGYNHMLTLYLLSCTKMGNRNVTMEKF